MIKGLTALIAVLLGAMPAPAFAGAPPLRPGAGGAAAGLCLAYRRPARELALSCEQALAEYGGDSRRLSVLHNNFGRALDELGRREAARAQYRLAIGLQPLAPAPWRNLGWSLWSDDRYAEAEQAFRRALALRVSADSLAGLAASLRMQERDAQEAMRLLERALALNPGYSWAMVEKGWLHLDAGEYAEAQDLFARALAIDGEYASAAYGLARALSWQQDFDAALGAINRALGLEAEDTTYLAFRAFIYRQLGEGRRALADGMRVMALAPGSDEGYVQTARALALLGRMDEALDVMQTGLEGGADSVFFHYAHADILSDAGRWEEALASIDRGLRLPGVDETDYNLRAYILINMGRDAEAAQASRAALEFAPADLVALLNLAYAEAGQGRTDRALVALLRARAAGLESADIDEFIMFALSNKQYLLAARVRQAMSGAGQETR